MRFCMAVKLSPFGERERAGRALHRVPLGQLHQRLQLGAGPVAEVALQQALVDLHLHAAGGGDGRRGLACALERRCVDRVDLGQRGDAFGGPLCLLHARPRPGAGRERDRAAACRWWASGRVGPAAPAWRAGSGLRSRHGSSETYCAWRGFARSVAATRCVTAVRCPRLVAWREQVAVEKRAAYRDQTYWGRGVPGFRRPAGPHHGARAGTGRSRCEPHRSPVHRRPLGRLAVPGDASCRPRQPAHLRERSTTGWSLTGAWVAAAVKCAPPDNKPLPDERDACRPFLRREIALLPYRAQVVVCLGGVRLRGGLRRVRGAPASEVRPRRGSRRRRAASTLLCSFHPSQQNTFTGRLTEPMLDAVFSRAVMISGR